MLKLFEEITKNLNAATFGAGVIFGVALSIAAVVVVSYVLRYWKAVLILSAVTAAVSLFLLAF